MTRERNYDFRIIPTVIFILKSSRIYTLARTCWWGPNKAETLLATGINRAELQRKLLSEKDTSSQNLRVVCDTIKGLNESTHEPGVLLHKSCIKPHQSRESRHGSKRSSSFAGQHHPLQECRFRQAQCYKCQRKGNVYKVCRSQTLMLASTVEREPDDSLLLMLLLLLLSHGT